MPAKKQTRRGNVPSGKVRLQKVLAQAGLASRRGAEDMITSGRVTIDGEIVDKLPCFVVPGKQEIRVDGSRLHKAGKVYLALNKPVGFICTSGIGEGKRAVDLAPRGLGRLHAVGRLDAASEGLLLITNDGELTNIATHPRYGFEKIYEVTVKGEVDSSVPSILKKGIFLAGGKASCESVRIIRRFRGGAVLSIKLKEGRNRQIRRMLASIGLNVQRLCRVSIGTIRLHRLKSGATRHLTSAEVKYLKAPVASPRKKKTRS